MDHQWIHVDVDRAKDGPFGAPIAHGNLTIAIMGHLPRSQKEETPSFEGQKLSINYGFDRVRFVAPVKAGADIRGRFTLAKYAEPQPGVIETQWNVTVEIKGEDKPALVAQWKNLRFE